MKAYIGIKFHPDNRNRATIELLSQLLASCGFETVCVRRDLEQWGAVPFSPEALMQQTCTVIDTCDLVVIELTEKGVGLGIEAGYAYARGLPVVTIARVGADISTTLRGISTAVCLYRGATELGAFFSRVREALTDTAPDAPGRGVPVTMRREAPRHR